MDDPLPSGAFPLPATRADWTHDWKEVSLYHPCMACPSCAGNWVLQIWLKSVVPSPGFEFLTDINPYQPFYSRDNQGLVVANDSSMPSDKEDEEEETQQGQCLGYTANTPQQNLWCHGVFSSFKALQPCYRHDDGNQDVCWAKAKLMQHLRFTATHGTHKSIFHMRWIHTCLYYM